MEQLIEDFYKNQVESVTESLWREYIKETRKSLLIGGGLSSGIGPLMLLVAFIGELDDQSRFEIVLLSLVFIIFGTIILFYYAKFPLNRHAKQWMLRSLRLKPSGRSRGAYLAILTVFFILDTRWKTFFTFPLQVLIIGTLLAVMGAFIVTTYHFDRKFVTPDRVRWDHCVIAFLLTLPVMLILPQFSVILSIIIWGALVYLIYQRSIYRILVDTTHLKVRRIFPPRTEWFTWKQVEHIVLQKKEVGPRGEVPDIFTQLQIIIAGRSRPIKFNVGFNRPDILSLLVKNFLESLKNQSNIEK